MDNGKVWFITGAARGIGAEIARAALAAGHMVVATGRHIDTLRKVYGEFGDAVLPLALDVADEAQAVARVVDQHVDAADIEAQFATNVFGLMHVTRAALPLSLIHI